MASSCLAFTGMGMCYVCILVTKIPEEGLRKSSSWFVVIEVTVTHHGGKGVTEFMVAKSDYEVKIRNQGWKQGCL